MPITANPASRIDLVLLDEIEQRLQELLESTEKLELPEPEPNRSSAPRVGEAIDAHLTGWQDRLTELSRQSSELERELTAQEQSLRKWFEALAARKKLLQSLTT